MYHAPMGRLVDTKRREENRRNRRGRREVILEGARKSLLSRPLADLTLEAIDRSAGQRPGTASMYFGTLEGLVEYLVREEYSSWFERIEDLLPSDSTSLSTGDLAVLLADTAMGRPLFLRLLAIMPATADRQTAEMGRLLDLETWRLGRFRQTGLLLESRCPGLEPGDGTVILRRTVDLAAALEPLLNPPAGLTLARQEETLSTLYPDAVEELHSLLTAILRR